MKKLLFTLIIFTTISISLNQSVLAQVSVFPITVFTSSASRFGTLVVTNKSSSVQEVSLSFRFGYPASDSTGNIVMVYNNKEEASKYSISPYIKCFPKRFIIQPGSRQVVKILITPPADTKNQVYWSRVVTHAQPQISSLQANNARMSARVIFAVNYVTALFYKSGNVNAATEINHITAQPDSIGTRISVDMTRKGNAPLLGRCHLSVTDQSGKSVFTETDPIAVYFNMVKNFQIPQKNLEKNSVYNVKVTLDADREDISADDAFQLPSPVSKEMSFKFQ